MSEESILSNLGAFVAYRAHSISITNCVKTPHGQNWLFGAMGYFQMQISYNPYAKYVIYIKER